MNTSLKYIKKRQISMCGIAGWFSQNPITSNSKNILQSMANAIKHRGPDGQGEYLSEFVGLAHTRLAIIDIESGHQPMKSADEQFVITYNGEIYNYKELRSHLITKGSVFRTKSDTEVIIQLYQQFGWEGFNQLRGMYAFALWDKKNNLGLLVRDPTGIKPLFKAELSNNTLVFGSEAKSILAYDSSLVSMDPASLHLLLNFRYLPGEITMFQNISQLGPGNILIWHENGKKEFQKIKPTLSSSSKSSLELLSESIDLHCTADVEVGCYLSGGIDSAAICALVNRKNNNLRSFTMAVGDDPNEAKNAAKTASLLGIENICGKEPTEISNLNRLIKHLEVPKINAYQVSKLAEHTSKYVKVVLSGLGADELFYGYNAHNLLHKANLINKYIPTLVTQTLSHIGNAFTETIASIEWTEPQRALKILDAANDWPKVYGLLRNVWDTNNMRANIYGSRMLDSELPNAFSTLESLWPQHEDPVKSMAMFEWNNKMVNDLLWQEDRVSMAEGLEVRVPYLDIELANNIKSMRRTKLMPHGKSKGYMKDMLCNTLHREILSRPKSGFQVDSPTFVKYTLMPLVKVWLSTERIKKYEIFNPNFVHEVLKLPPKKWLRWHYFMLYQMLLTHIWIEEFEEIT